MNFSSYDEEIEENLINKIQSLHNDFTKVDVQNVYIYFLYVVNQTCENYKRIVTSLNNGVLLKDDLMSEIVKNRNESGRRFNVTGIYNYNFDVDNLVDFINNGHKMNEYKNVENITFNSSIDYFEHHNSVFVLLSNEKSKHTKKSGNIPKKKTLKNII
jgi:hypothetical protein